MPAAVLGGTGLYNIPGLAVKETIVKTPYGDALVFIGQGADDDIVFLTRHGPSHGIPPHKINFRANMKALAQLGVKRIIANYAVGGINAAIPPLGLAQLGDFIDFTTGRESTYYDGDPALGGVQHAEMSQPYCPALSDKLHELAPDFGLSLFRDAVYATFNGPRFETPAEIRMMRTLGCDVVGMTGAQEVVLARELGMTVGAVALSINWAAGIQRSLEIVYDGLPELREKVLALSVAVLRATKDDDCEPAKLI